MELLRIYWRTKCHKTSRREICRSKYYVSKSKSRIIAAPCNHACGHRTDSSFHSPFLVSCRTLPHLRRRPESGNWDADAEGSLRALRRDLVSNDFAAFFFLPVAKPRSRSMADRWFTLLQYSVKMSVRGMRGQSGKKMASMTDGPFAAISPSWHAGLISCLNPTICCNFPSFPPRYQHDLLSPSHQEGRKENYSTCCNFDWTADQSRVTWWRNYSTWGIRHRCHFFPWLTPHGSTP